MLTVVLGLSGALVYGFADFLGGVAARRARPVVVTTVTAAVGLLPLLVGLALLGGRFSGPAVVWGAVGGAAGSVGVLLLYAALAVGPMSILSPLTAVFAAVVPVLVALARGTALSGLAIAALVVAVVAVVLVASSPDRSGARLTLRGVLAASIAGCGFGGIVLAFDQTPSDSGIAPLLVARVVQVVLLGGAAAVSALAARSGGPDRHPTTAPARRRGRLVLVVVACGVLDALANVFIQAGLHSSDDPTTLPVMSVLNALYPIGTVVLAGVVLRERLTVLQSVGIGLAVVASIGLALA